MHGDKKQLVMVYFKIERNQERILFSPLRELLSLLQ